MNDLEMAFFITDYMSVVFWFVFFIIAACIVIRTPAWVARFRSATPMAVNCWRILGLFVFFHLLSGVYAAVQNVWLAHANELMEQMPFEELEATMKKRDARRR